MAEEPNLRTIYKDLRQKADSAVNYFVQGHTGKQKAIVAIARKLLKWIERSGTTPGKLRATGKLLRHNLGQLDLAKEMEQVQYSGRVYRAECGVVQR